MRISDWSSDVCSSDLDGTNSQPSGTGIFDLLAVRAFIDDRNANGDLNFADIYQVSQNPVFFPWFTRSEEHTSELQSLMRISYAVFCLKKKTYHITKSLIAPIRKYTPR